MTITEAIYSRMAGNATITSAVPATRILPPGNWQNIARPYIIHFPVSMEPTETHAGQTALRIWNSYQVSIFSDDFQTGENAAVAVRDNLPGTTTAGTQIYFRPGSPWCIGNRPVDERATSQVFHFVLEFVIAEAL